MSLGRVLPVSLAGLANLRQVLPSDELSVHPVAAAQVEPELIKAMRRTGETSGA